MGICKSDFVTHNKRVAKPTISAALATSPLVIFKTINKAKIGLIKPRAELKKKSPTIKVLMTLLNIVLITFNFIVLRNYGMINNKKVLLLQKTGTLEHSFRKYLNSVYTFI
jgi:hypothetical protein